MSLKKLSSKILIARISDNVHQKPLMGEIIFMLRLNRTYIILLIELNLLIQERLFDLSCLLITAYKKF